AVSYDGDLDVQLVERAVVFVRLDDDEFAAAGLRVRVEVAQDAPDDDGGIEAGLLQHGRDHRGGGGLAVRAGDADGALAVDDLAEHLRAADDRDALAPRGVDLIVGAFDCGGDDDGVGALDVRGIVADGDGDAA